MSENFKRENREIPSVSQLTFDWERSANVSDGTADMYADGKSDEPVLPATSTNNDGSEPLAESSEERGSAERNVAQAALHRTPSRIKRKRGYGPPLSHKIGPFGENFVVCRGLILFSQRGKRGTGRVGTPGKLPRPTFFRARN